MNKWVPILLSLAFPILTKAQETKGIIFRQDLNWEMLLRKGKEEHKNIFIDAYATWCAPCKQMDTKVYPDSALGELMNKNFISIKVQMDSTKNDNEHVKSWHKDSNKMLREYNIIGFPSFLFFSPDGELIYKDLGYKDVATFSQLASLVADPRSKEFRNTLKDYQNGKKDYAHMANLALTTKALINDDKLSFIIAKDYKENYLDKLPPSAFLTKINIDFIVRNFGSILISSNDQLFKACYFHADYIDSLIGIKGFSNSTITEVISKEDIQPRLFKQNLPIVKNPDWKSIQKKIASKYPKVNSKELILNEKIYFYRKIEDWRSYTQYKSEQIYQTPLRPEGMDVFFTLNAPAWDAFENCEDNYALNIALDWSELSLKLEPNAVQYLDTKANLLYKLGRVPEAILFEKEAILQERRILKKGGNFHSENAGFVPEFQANIQKMEKGLPTWPIHK
ncbi:Thioredoxin-like [Chitinophaga sp. CF118]|uniref:thioredoxin family protein n=1 Tax=Chitinophaga sp. CF118 TaxID=1884367 RepID=UPI0008F118C5|nr:thioredoxin fold domain-containing protein [Chitinophaga sp. CF118]SFE44926.1 Thioredoxin-like [Chitinophaga sp. CF118]